MKTYRQGRELGTRKEWHVLKHRPECFTAASGGMQLGSCWYRGHALPVAVCTSIEAANALKSLSHLYEVQEAEVGIYEAMFLTDREHLSWLDHQWDRVERKVLPRGPWSRGHEERAQYA